jgi:hypothetical protein
MRDWKPLVEERLKALNLSPDAKEDVIAELAAHLEDSAATNPEASESEDRALLDIQWPRLRRAIERARRKEVTMKRLTKVLLGSIAILFPAGLVLLFLGRGAVVQLLIWTVCTAMLLCAAASEGNRLSQLSRSLWLPALTTFFGASVSLMLCQFFGMQPRMVWVHNLGMSFYWPWLGTLPLFGAAGAHLSKRAQGRISSLLTAALFPALIMLTVMLLILPWGLAIDGFHFFRLVAFGLGLINWVVIPAAALLIGAVPFLRDSMPVSSQS